METYSAIQHREMITNKHKYLIKKKSKAHINATF